MDNSYSWFIIPLSFLVAIILTLLPMPDWTVWLRPAWVLMLIIYWIMSAPHRINVGTAWGLGIVLDVLNGTLLGEHALGFGIVAYIVARMHTQLLMYPLLQQGLTVFALVLLYLFIIFVIQGFIGQPPSDWLYWSPALTSMLLWPWVVSIIRDSRRRFRAI